MLQEIRMQIIVDITCKFTSQSWKWGHIQNHKRSSQSLGVTWNLALIGRRISQDASLFLCKLCCHSLHTAGVSPTRYWWKICETPGWSWTLTEITWFENSVENILFATNLLKHFSLPIMRNEQEFVTSIWRAH